MPTYYIATTGSGTGDGSLGDPFKTFQEGVSVAVSGDTLIVQDGTYSGAGNININFAGKDLTVRSANGKASCIWDGGLSSRFSDITTGSAGLTLDGFTFQNGNDSYGGALRFASNVSPTVQNCDFLNNNGSTAGGAVNCYGANPTFKFCYFQGNTSGSIGAGALRATGASNTPLFEDCVFDTNTSTGSGGAIVGDGSYTLRRCTFLSNSSSSGTGGAIHYTGNPLIEDCTFTGNSALKGGAINADYATGAIKRILADDNSATVNGGGVRFHFSSARMEYALITNNSSVGGGKAGGVYVYGGSSVVELYNCTIVGNSAGTYNGGGVNVSFDATVNIINSIIRDNLPTANVAIDSDLPGTTTSYTCTFSNVGETQAGAGNVDAPLFVNAAGKNYKLVKDSPSKDTGTYIVGFHDQPGMTDLVSNLIDADPDMGAYEYLMTSKILRPRQHISISLF